MALKIVKQGIYNSLFTYCKIAILLFQSTLLYKSMELSSFTPIIENKIQQSTDSTWYNACMSELYSAVSSLKYQKSIK